MVNELSAVVVDEIFTESEEKVMSNSVKNVPFNFVNGSLVLFINDKQFFVSKEDLRLKEVMSILADEQKTQDDLLECLNKSSVTNYIESCPTNDGKAYVKDGEVYFNGQPVHSSLVDRIKECIKFGLPFDNMLRFLENIAQNPSFRSTTELFDFLSNKSLPITPDGCFLAYKAIRNDWKDKYSGTIDNSITGKPVVIPRNNVDDEREHECSFGLHVGALPYVQSYGSGIDDRIGYVKVNPKNVVSVPKDHNAQKVRVCEYLVLGEYKGELNQYPVYNDKIEGQGSPVNNINDWDDFDDDWQDEEDDYEPEYYDDFDEDEEDDEDEWEDDDDFDYDYDDSLNKIPTFIPCDKNDPKAFTQVKDNLGVKPNGQRYWNYRKSGKFAKKDN